MIVDELCVYIRDKRNQNKKNALQKIKKNSRLINMNLKN